MTIKKNETVFSPEGLTSYMTFRYPIWSLTMFKDKSKPPMKFSEFEFSTLDIPFEDALKKTDELLTEAVQSMCNPYDNIGVVLSGGVDSSLILAILRKIYPNKKIHTYTAGFTGEDEFRYARIVSNKFGTIHTEKRLGPEDYIGEGSLLHPLIRHKKAPLHPNEIALAKVEGIGVAEGCEIMLCGEGGDDIFGGYGQNLRMYMNYDRTCPFFDFFLKNYRYFSLEDRKYLIKEWLLVDDLELLNKFIENDTPSDIRDKVLYFTQKFHTPGLIYRGINAMEFNGLPSAFPYMNSKLVKFVNSLPFDYKVHWKSEEHRKKAESMNFREISENMDIPKYILKKIAESYLPKEVIYRKKYGFPVPFDNWFKTLNKWDFDKSVFNTSDISRFGGWKKFMAINLDAFIKEFKDYKG